MSSSFIQSYLAETFSLAGQRIVVVGGGGTIGDEIIKRLARAGAVVVPTRTSAEGVEKSVSLIHQAAEPRSCPGGVVMDMCDQGSIDAGIDQLAQLMEEPPTGVVINAGGHDPNLIIGPDKHFSDTDPERVATFFQRNLFGQEHVLRRLSERTQSTPGFAGVVICSVAPTGLSRVPHYRMAKVAVEELVRFLALDHGNKYGHRFLGIAPGFVTSGNPNEQNAFATKDPVRYGAIVDHIALNRQFTPTHDRWATGAEIADVVTFAFSKAARYMTGTTITVDAGFSVNKLGNSAL
ncbi:MAG: SDR family oxidoreductase [Bdellovibrionales bacterium]|nr:SDR family oxidoreductase [Bdellovibrionales bacterium]